MGKGDEGARGFGVTLAAIDDGAFHEECTVELHKLNERLSAHALDFGKAKGTLTLILSISVDKKGVAQVDADVKVKAPKAKKSAMFWLTEGNNLSVENPKQLKLGVREVPRGNEEQRDVGARERAR